MCKKLIFPAFCIFILGLLLTSSAQAELVGWWKLDDGSGTTAVDSSGYGNDGTLMAGTAGFPEWKTTGGDFRIGTGALEFHGGVAEDEGDFVDCGTSAIFDITENITFALWVKIDAFTMTYQYVFSKGLNYMILRANDTRYLRVVFNGLDVGAGGDAYYAGGTTIPIDDGQWHHVAGSYDSSTGIVAFYTDGVLEESKISSGSIPTNDESLCIGMRRTRKGTDAIIDDVRLYNHTLTAVEILSAMQGEPFPFASGPSPENGGVNFDTWVNLSWHPGELAVSHDLYIGDDFDVVNEATRDSDEFRGNKTDTFYIAGFPGYAYPDGLVPGTTYYWRIDEVNEAEPNSPWKGDVWSFSIPPKTAYNPDPADGAEFIPTDATLSWTAGFGAKLHYIVFGEDFDSVVNATNGISTGPVKYSPGPLQLAKTYYWRVDEFDGAGTYKGEVWSFTTEGAVSGPNPTNGALDVSPTQILTWDAGAVAASHEVYFGTNMEAVKNATKSSPEYKGPKALGEEIYDPGNLLLETTYYWRIDEVNDINPDSPWEGKVWSFTTGDFFVIDDFEGYDAGENQIWYAWKDGLGYGTQGTADYYAGNGTGAAVGDETTASYTEETIVHGGHQSMPLSYNNNKQGFSKYSETEMTLTDMHDWTDEGVAELSLWFRGYLASTGSFVESPVGTFTMTGSGSDIWNVNGVEADEFHFAYKTLSGAGSITAKVVSVSNTNAWAKAGVMIRETLNPDSAHAFACITPANGVASQYRPSTGGTSGNYNQTGVAAPYWVKLERSISGLFTVSQSANGTSWQPVTGAVAQTIPMGTNVYIGLAVTAHDPALTCQAVFSNVTTTGNVTGQWTDQDIGINSNDAEPLYVAVSNSAGNTAVVVNDDPASAQVNTWTEWVIPLSAFADQGINLTDVDKIAIGLGTRGNMTMPGGSGKMYFDDIRLYRPAAEPEPQP
jgi:hypothetical protein